MPNPNPWNSSFAITRPALRRETVTYQVKDGEGHEHALTITLEELDELGQGVFNDKYREYVQKYVTEKKAAKAPGPSGERLPVSESLCRQIAWLEAMQRPNPVQDAQGKWHDQAEWKAPEGAYGFVSWAGVARIWRAAWDGIWEQAARVQGAEPGEAAADGEDPEGNADAPTASAPSAPIGN